MDGERLIRVVHEDGKHDAKRDSLMVIEEIGDGHLSNSEHTAPATIGVVVSGRQERPDVGTVGHEDILPLRFFILHIDQSNYIPL